MSIWLPNWWIVFEASYICSPISFSLSVHPASLTFNLDRCKLVWGNEKWTGVTVKLRLHYVFILCPFLVWPPWTSVFTSPGFSAPWWATGPGGGGLILSWWGQGPPANGHQAGISCDHIFVPGSGCSEYDRVVRRGASSGSCDSDILFDQPLLRHFWILFSTRPWLSDFHVSLCIV